MTEAGLTELLTYVDRATIEAIFHSCDCLYRITREGCRARRLFADSLRYSDVGSGVSSTST